MVEFVMTTASGTAVIRSGWIVRFSEDFPRLTTCYVKRGPHEVHSVIGGSRAPEDLPDDGLTRGQIGTVVEHLLVEFSDEQGQTYAIAAGRPYQLMALHRKNAAAR